MSEKIVFYKDQQAFVQEMSYEEAGRLLLAAFDYSMGLSEKEVIKKHFPKSDRFLKSAWNQTKTKLDYTADRERQMSEANTRAAQTRWNRQKQVDANACERIQADANASECNAKNATECIPMPTIHNNNKTNTKHNATHRKINGKLYRTAEDGQRYYLDDGSPVGEGEV